MSNTMRFISPQENRKMPFIADASHRIAMYRALNGETRLNN